MDLYPILLGEQNVSFLSKTASACWPSAKDHLSKAKCVKQKCLLFWLSVKVISSAYLENSKLIILV